MKEFESIKSYMLSPITPTHHRTYRLIMSFKPLTKYDYKRLVEAIRLYNRSIVGYTMTGKENSGIFGDAVELFGHRPTSTLVRVRPKGKCDNYILIDDKRRKMETKTNSGQIQDFFNMTEAEINTTYIHYVMDINVRPSKKNPSGIRQLDFICTLSHFLTRVKEYDAFKENGSNKWGKIYNLQGDSAKLYKAFLRDAEDLKVLPFNRKAVYTEEDF